MSPFEAKNLRRSEARAVVKHLPAAERQAQAEALTQRIVASTEWQNARKVLLYMPLPDEVNLEALIPAALAAGKRVGLPAFDGSSGVYLVREILNLAEDVVPGYFGIREPGPNCRTVAVAEMDLVLVPGLAFDRDGGRLGRGRGFYDRLLVSVTGRVWGVGFREQVGAPVPRESHDRRMDAVITAAALGGR